MKKKKASSGSRKRHPAVSVASIPPFQFGVRHRALSPDGKFVAYDVGDVEVTRVLLSQVGTDSTRTVFTIGEAGETIQRIWWESSDRYGVLSLRRTTGGVRFSRFSLDPDFLGPSWYTLRVHEVLSADIISAFPVGYHIYFSTKSLGLWEWNIDSGSLERIPNVPRTCEVTAVALRADEELVVAGHLMRADTPQRVVAWVSGKRQRLNRIGLKPCSPDRAVSISPDGRLLLRAQEPWSGLGRIEVVEHIGAKKQVRLAVSPRYLLVPPTLTGITDTGWVFGPHAIGHISTGIIEGVVGYVDMVCRSQNESFNGNHATLVDLTSDRKGISLLFSYPDQSFQVIKLDNPPLPGS